MSRPFFRDRPLFDRSSAHGDEKFPIQDYDEAARELEHIQLDAIVKAVKKRNLAKQTDQSQE